jgi:hypothetical protein
MVVVEISNHAAIVFAAAANAQLRVVGNNISFSLCVAFGIDTNASEDPRVDAACRQGVTGCDEDAVSSSPLPKRGGEEAPTQCEGGRG